jgi:hypothetical protein
MTPEEELQRAGEARRVLDTPVFQEACARIDEQLARNRRAVPLSQSDMHTRLIIMEQVWGNIKDWLEQVAQSGNFAQIEIERQRTLRERAAETVRAWRRTR